MRIATLVFLSLLFIQIEARCDEMSIETFATISSEAADDAPLIPELAQIPLWTNATATINLKYQDGHSLIEEVTVTARTIQGRYIVYTANSKIYNRPIISILTYDKKASACRLWAQFGNTLTSGTVLYDFEKGIYATSSSYGDGFTELGVGSFTDTVSSEKTLVFKNGAFFLTREVRTVPFSYMRRNP